MGLRYIKKVPLKFNGKPHFCTQFQPPSRKLEMAISRLLNEKKILVVVNVGFRRSERTFHSFSSERWLSGQNFHSEKFWDGGGATVLKCR